MEWFRLYNEFANDPKLLSFSKSERYDVVCLLCLASSSQERGTLLLDDEDLAGYLSVSLDDFLKLTSRLIKKAILERTPDGWLRFVHWAARQPHSDSAAGRMRAYRERQKSNAVQNSSDDCSTQLRNGDVTVTNRTEKKREEKNREEERVARTRVGPPPLETFLKHTDLLGMDRISAEKCWLHYEANGWPENSGIVNYDAVAKKWNIGNIERAKNAAPVKNGTAQHSQPEVAPMDNPRRIVAPAEYAARCRGEG